MNLGAFSSSLNVNDLTKSKEFYEALGFVVFAGSMEKKYLIMKNENAQPLDQLDDIRAIQQDLKNKEISLITEVANDSLGPASFMLKDPDGKVKLIDQHV